MDEAIESRRLAKLAIIQGAIGSRQGCKLTDDHGRFIKVMRCDGDRLIDDQGGAWILSQVSLPLRLDPDLIECLDYLKVTADEVAKHPQFVPSDAFPVLTIWETLLCEAERAVLRTKLSPEQKNFWKQTKLAAQTHGA